MEKNILSVKDLQVDYQTAGGYFRAVNHVSLELYENEVFGVVGESGSGKSTMCSGILRLLPASARVEAGELAFGGQDLLRMPEKAFRRVRWEQISYIPQSAMNTLNPIATVRTHFAETIRAHEGKVPKRELDARTAEALARVWLAEEVADKYTHELSGGMKQRVCIAMATLLSPRLIVADEPTSALDVISQRSVLQILSAVRSKLGASMIMIGHDMALQAQIADRIGIMYAGYFVEIGTVEEIFRHPVHPYTQSLIRAIPSIRRKEDIHALSVHELSAAERERLRAYRPLVEVTPGHLAADFS